MTSVKDKEINNDIPPPWLLSGVCEALAKYFPGLTPEILVSCLKNKDRNSNGLRLPEKKFYFEAEVQAMLGGISYWSVRRLRNKGLLKSFKSGRKTVYEYQSLLTYFQHCKKQSIHKHNNKNSEKVSHEKQSVNS